MTHQEFNFALAQNESKLKNFARKFTADSDEALDLVQETCLKALRYKEKFRENINLSAWLYTIMRNTFINQFNRKQRYKIYNESETGDGEYSALNIAEDNGTPDIMSQLRTKEILSTMGQLNEELISPFRMYVDGFKYMEIAEKTQLPLGTVKNKIFRARKQIAKKLKNLE